MTGAAPIRTSGTGYFARRRAPPYADGLPPAELRGYDAAQIAFAAGAWTMRAEQERRSAGEFAALASALVDCGDPVDLAAAFSQVALDELAHAELCATIAGELSAPVPRATPIARETSAAQGLRRGQALRTLLVAGAMGETISCALFATGRNVAREPRTRAALGRILRDEIGHSRASWEALRALWPSLSSEERDALQETARSAFAQLEQSQMVPVLKRLERGEPFEPVWATLGVLPPERRVEAFYGAVERRVTKGLTRLGLDGAGAWETRYANP